MIIWVDAQLSPAIAAWINRTFDKNYSAVPTSRFDQFTCGGLVGWVAS